MITEEHILRWFPIFTFAASLGFGLYVFLSRRDDEKKHQQYIRQTIDNNIRELVTITNTIHARSEEVYDSNAKAKLLESYFSRQVRRLELLRLNVENKLPQLANKYEYTKNVKQILEIQSWLIEKYDDPTVAKERRFYLWKEDHSGGELTDKTQNLVDIATKMNIIKPVTTT